MPQVALFEARIRELLVQRLAIFSERGRARMAEAGRRRCVAINPALLDGRE